MMVAGLEFTRIRGSPSRSAYTHGRRVVKLTRLTDNNRARAQNQDTFMSVRFGVLFTLIISRTDGIAQLTR